MNTLSVSNINLAKNHFIPNKSQSRPDQSPKRIFASHDDSTHHELHSVKKRSFGSWWSILADPHLLIGLGATLGLGSVAFYLLYGAPQREPQLEKSKGIVDIKLNDNKEPSLDINWIVLKELLFKQPEFQIKLIEALADGADKNSNYKMMSDIIARYPNDFIGAYNILVKNSDYYSVLKDIIQKILKEETTFLAEAIINTSSLSIAVNLNKNILEKLSQSEDLYPDLTKAIEARISQGDAKFEAVHFETMHNHIIESGNLKEAMPDFLQNIDHKKILTHLIEEISIQKPVKVLKVAVNIKSAKPSTEYRPLPGRSLGSNTDNNHHELHSVKKRNFGSTVDIVREAIDNLGIG